MQSGMTMVQIAEENGVTLDEFKKAMLNQRESYIDQMVKDGKMTQENADSIKKAIEERINSCDGTGHKGEGMGMGIGHSGKAGAAFASGMGARAGHRGSGHGATVQQ